MSVRQIFRERLAYHMRVQRYRLADIAGNLGVTTQSVQNWTCGRTMPSLVRVEQLATFLCVPVNDLIT